MSHFNVKMLGMLLFLYGCVLSCANGTSVYKGETESSSSSKVLPGRLKSFLMEGKDQRLEMISQFLAELRTKSNANNIYSTLSDKASKRIKRSTKRDEASYNPNIEGRYYTDEIFWKYGNEDALSLENFDILLHNIGLEMMTRFANEDIEGHDHGDHEGHDHGDHDGHDHGDHDGHDHGDHDGHDHGDHEGHDHGDHEGHDHGDHEGHHHGDHRKKRHAHGHAGHNHNHNDTNVKKCLNTTELLYDYGLDQITELTAGDFVFLCPALIYQLDPGNCKFDGRQQVEKKGGKEDLVWVYTMVAVLIISLCALFGILCIPRRGGNENYVMQFLIAMAMGSMSGDGMLHLIPHSMIPHHDHSIEDSHGGHHHHEDEMDHTDGLYKGLVALIGVYSFFFLERAFAIIRSRKDAKEKRSSAALTPMMSVNGGSGNDEDGSAHGHSHGGLFSCTSLAMIIIVGDMFHNFCDGLAIGAAFAGSFSVGISTSIAVFCHELPHEIGDFAVLITSGMGVKKAIGFNLLSTVPCFLGAAIGLELGSLGDLSLWIFAFVGGLFMYIALVDLVPEMTRAYARPGSPWVPYLLVHCGGIFLGVIIMVILGIYEEDLQRILE